MSEELERKKQTARIEREAIERHNALLKQQALLTRIAAQKAQEKLIEDLKRQQQGGH